MSLSLFLTPRTNLENQTERGQLNTMTATAHPGPAMFPALAEPCKNILSGHSLFQEAAFCSRGEGSCPACTCCGRRNPVVPQTVTNQPFWFYLLCISAFEDSRFLQPLSLSEDLKLSCVLMKVKVLVAQSYLTLWTVTHPGNSPGKNTGVGNHSLLQGIFLSQGSNPGLPHCRQTLYRLNHLAPPKLSGFNLSGFLSGSPLTICFPTY